jgi:hypothetical protein
MPRLDGDPAVVTLAQRREEPSRGAALPFQRWRELDQQPILARIGATSAKNASIRFPVPTRRASCVIARGSFTEKRKRRGTLCAQRSYVDARCDRWNVELISTASNTAAYRSRCDAASGKRSWSSRGRLHPAVPMRVRWGDFTFQA